jgi:hypothetical protein
MGAMGSFLNWLLHVKSNLPSNGDWVFVTQTPITKQPQQDDLSAKHDTPEKVLKDLKSNDLESIRLIYERAKAYESTIENIGNLTRDKAKALLSTTSMVSAVFFGVASFFSSSSIKFPWWAISIELIIFILLASQLIRSLVIAMDVMTREQAISASPDEFLASYRDSDASERHTISPLVNAYKNAIAQTVAYSNQTHGHINGRKNRLILGQHAFRYGLVYFVLLIMVHTFATISYVNVEPNGRNTAAAERQEKLFQTLLTNQDNLLKGASESMREITLLHQADSEIMGKQRELEMKIQELSNLISILQQESKAAHSRPGEAKKGTKLR